jgi:hypothetical protein
MSPTPALPVPRVSEVSNEHLHDYVLRAGYEKRKVDPDAVTIGQRRVLANIRGD